MLVVDQTQAPVNIGVERNSGGAKANNFYKTLLFPKVALERLYATIDAIRRWRLAKSEVRWNQKVCFSTRPDLFTVVLVPNFDWNSGQKQKDEKSSHRSYPGPKGEVRNHSSRQ